MSRRAIGWAPFSAAGSVLAMPVVLARSRGVTSVTVLSSLGLATLLRALDARSSSGPVPPARALVEPLAVPFSRGVIRSERIP